MTKIPALIFNSPAREIGGIERRDLRGLPGDDLRSRDGTPLWRLRLGPLRKELAAMGFVGDPYAGKSDLLAAAEAHFADDAETKFNPESIVTGILDGVKD